MSARDLDVSENSVRQGGLAFPAFLFYLALNSPFPTIPSLFCLITMTIIANDYIVLTLCQGLLSF